MLHHGAVSALTITIPSGLNCNMFKAVITHALQNTQLGNSIKKGEYNDVVKKLQLFRAIFSDFFASMHP